MNESVTRAHDGGSFQWTHVNSKGLMTCATVSHWCDFDGSDDFGGLDEYDRMVVSTRNTPEGLSLVDGLASSMDPCRS